MTKIPVIVVDDERVDRRIATRRLSDSDEFGQILEAENGDAFLEKYFNGDSELQCDDTVPLVLMDVNMPGLDGFETVEEMQRRMAAGHGPKSVVVMMFTSSENPADRARAFELASVRGYVIKPLDGGSILTILTLYRS